ncbi:MAG: GFA family protein [Hyphomicrobiaceae bacterium]
MSSRSEHAPLYSGGCQCGAIRFALYAEPVRVGVCHCRMCQKAAGAPFMALADVPLADFAWTRGTPATFRSSSRADRDFCGTCGTPLTYRKIGGDKIELMCGAFDAPEKVVPTYVVGTESKVDWVDTLPALPGRSTAANMGTETVAGIVSYQHPDRDTPDDWTPVGA